MRWEGGCIISLSYFITRITSQSTLLSPMKQRMGVKLLLLNRIQTIYNEIATGCFILYSQSTPMTKFKRFSGAKSLGFDRIGCLLKFPSLLASA